MVQLPKIWSNEEEKTYSKDPPRSEVAMEEEEEEDDEEDGITSKEEELMMGGSRSIDDTDLSEGIQMVLERSVDYLCKITEAYPTENIFHPHGGNQNS